MKKGAINDYYSFTISLHDSMSIKLNYFFNVISADISVPAVCLVLEGGPGSLETVKSAIQNGTPAVIVEG